MLCYLTVNLFKVEEKSFSVKRSVFY
jgi:hypothetical protein